MDRFLPGKNLPRILSPSITRIQLRIHLSNSVTNSFTEMSIVVILGLFVTFGSKYFGKRPAMVLTEGIQNLWLDGFMRLIAITHAKLGKLMAFTRYPEQMRENVEKFDMKMSTASWNKMRELRHTMIQYLLQQIRFGTGENKSIERENDVRHYVGGMPLLTDLCLAMRSDPLALIRAVGAFVTVIYGPAVTFAFPDAKEED